MKDIDRIKCNSHIYTNGSYVVIPDTKLHILKPDGTLVVSRKDLRNAGRITFLPDNKLLLCSSKAIVHMINLLDGQDIWTAPFTKSYFNLGSFAISPDRTFAYAYGNNHQGSFISRINLLTQEVDSYSFDCDIGTTEDILCDTEGIPCLLKTLNETIGGKQVLQSGIRIHDFDGIAPYSTTIWNAKWSSESRSSLCFFDSVDHILTSDLKVYHSYTGELIDLLENENSWVPPSKGTLGYWLDPNKQYLFIRYQNANVVIDTQAKKVVAQYASSWHGALVGNEYWICSEGKVLRKPFPSFEEIPPVKATIGMDWYFSKHPELW